MNLTFEQIKPLVHGAERKTEKDGTLWLLRFTEAQADFYKDIKEMYSPDLLHPSDVGFAHYAENLLAAIKPYLDK